MDRDIEEYNARLEERLKLKDKDAKEDREDFLNDKYTKQDNKPIRISKQVESLENVKNELRLARVNPATLYSLYNRNNFPKQKLLFDSDGTSYYPLDGYDLYAFKMKRGRMSLPFGEMFIYRSKKERINVYICNSVLGICDGNKEIVNEFEDAKPSIVCGTCDILFI
jgi:hypothetical protein